MALSKRKAKVPALTSASLETPDEGAVSRLVQVLLDAGIDGLGPLKSAHELAVWARTETGRGGSTDAAVAKVARQTLVRGGIGGFVTGVGGFLTMPIALPANVVEFYIGPTRMVAAIPDLRGNGVGDP